MLRLLINIFTVSLAVLVTSCFKEDEMVMPHMPGNYITDTITLGETYTNQVYYNLHDSNTVSSALRTAWDLGFESTPSGWRVTLNSSGYMKSVFLEGHVFGTPADAEGATWIFNPSDGSADSLVIGNWFTVNGNDTVGTNRLLLIDRGLDENGEPLGINQLVIDSLVKGTYYFRIAEQDGTKPRSYSIAKRGNVNHVLFSISYPLMVVSEPASTSWDLLFSKYTTLLYTDAGEPYPYLVLGVLLNPSFVEVAVDSISSFESINFEKAQSMSFTKQADKIGYLWKKYDFTLGSYTVNPDINYIIRDTRGFIYKFRFVGFYKFSNNRLEKGFPSFEYQKL